MTDRLNNLEERTGQVEHRLVRVEEKLETVSTSIEDLALSMARGFNAIDVAIDEQRRYTEFAFTRLESKMDAGFARVDSGFARLERKLDQFIGVQLATNQLVEQRLRPLES